MARAIIGLIAATLLLAACQPAEEPLPTLVGLPATATPEPPPTLEPTATSRANRLPPTFTPTTPPPTETPTPTPLPPTPTSTDLDAPGVILYVYNGDSIIAQEVDGSSSSLVMTFGVGVPLTDLAPSPDQQLIAFVGPGGGAAREVYIMNASGSYLQQISCLGFEDVRSPAWTPDGSALVWYAAQNRQSPGNLYRATIAGSNNCPTANGQGMLVRMETMDYHGHVFNRTGDRLFYVKDGNLLEFDSQTQASVIAAPGSGFGPNQRPVVNPVDGQLAYLRQQPSANANIEASLYLLESTDAGGSRLTFNTFVPPPVRAALWSPDGRYLLAVGETDIALRDMRTSRLTTLVSGLSSPTAIISPDSRFVAYTRPDGLGVAQWRVRELANNRDIALTRNPEGTIGGAVWLSSSSD